MSETRLAADEILPAGAPRLGFGCGDLFGGDRRQASIRLIEAALEGGIRYFDVARLYGDGSAEEVLGEVLGGMRDEVVIASKAGIIPWSMQTGARLTRKALSLARQAPGLSAVVPEPPPARERYGAFARAELERSIERSLKALRTDHLDLLLLHECELPDATSDETLSLFEKLRAAGKVRRFGIATHPDVTLRILERAPQTEVAQFASDALNRNVARLPAGWRGLSITHTAIKSALAALAPRLAADEAFAERYSQATGAAPNDRSALAGLLLQDALAAHPGLVLFSSSKPGRVREAAQTARQLDPARAERFSALLAGAELGAAA